MMTFLLFAPKGPEGTAQVDFVTCIVQSYFDTLLRYAVTFFVAVVLKVMDQKTLVKVIP